MTTDVTEPFTEVVLAHARRTPSAPAILPQSQPAITYQHLAEICRTVATRLGEENLAGRRIGTLVDGLDAAILQIAIPSSAVCVPLDARLGFDELKGVIRLFNLDALVATDKSELSRLAAEETGIDALACTISEPGWELTLTKIVKATPRRRGRRETHIAFLMRSSGTTGVQKIIPVTHGNVLALPDAMSGLLGLREGDRSAATLPLHYAAGLGQTLLSPLIMGGSVALPRPENRQNILSWIDELKPTWLTSSPATLRAMLHGIGAEACLSHHGIRFVSCGGSLVPEGLLVEAERRLGTPVLATYGLTEAGVVASQCPPSHARQRDTVGKTLPGLVSVRDTDGNEVPPGTPGMVCIRGPQVTPGYLGQPAVGEAWLETGDLGVMDDEGLLRITGRAKEMINRGGEKISPYEIEAAALAHPDIEQAAAFARPHPRLGEDPGLAVILRPGAAPSSDEIQRFLSERLIGFKVPRTVQFPKSFPLGPTGKIDRQALAARCADERRETVEPGPLLEYDLIQVWRELLDIETLGVEDDFFAMGGDSLLAEHMLTRVEEITQTRITLAQLEGAITIRNLVRTFCAETTQEQPLIERIRNGEGTPFYYCHGDVLTRGFYAQRLADHLDLTRPFHVINPPHYSSRDDNIPAVARRCVAQMMQDHPTGAFEVGGLCNGGLLAWEIAHQLLANGRDVDKVILVDTISLNARPAFRLAAPVMRLMPKIVPLQSGRSSPMAAIWLMILNHYTPAKLIRRLVDKTPPDIIGATPLELNLLRQVMSEYVPPPLSRPLHCLVAVESEPLPEFDQSQWRRLAPDHTITVVPGDHYTCVTTHLAALADAMRPLLHPAKSDQSRVRPRARKLPEPAH